MLDHSEWVNFHCTALPQGRGGHPIENLIVRGYTETVITAHRMVADMDAGPVYGRSESISLAGSKAAIQQRFVAPCVELIQEIVAREPMPVPQAGLPTWFERLGPDAYQAIWASRRG